MTKSISTKVLNVKIQENGIVRNTQGQFIARLIESVPFESEYLTDLPVPEDLLESIKNRKRERCKLAYLKTKQLQDQMHANNSAALDTEYVNQLAAIDKGEEYHPWLFTPKVGTADNIATLHNLLLQIPPSPSSHFTGFFTPPGYLKAETFLLKNMPFQPPVDLETKIRNYFSKEGLLVSKVRNVPSSEFLSVLFKDLDLSTCTSEMGLFPFTNELKQAISGEHIVSINLGISIIDYLIKRVNETPDPGINYILALGGFANNILDLISKNK